MWFRYAGIDKTDAADMKENVQIPLVSLIVPIHNGAALLGDTLHSIFGQTLQEFELILVDDASTDDLPSVLANFSDARLRLLHLEKNVGVANARNSGVSFARGQYIAFCDADDLCQPERLALQVAYLHRNPEVGICGSAFTCFSDQGDMETVCHASADAGIKAALMVGNCFGMSTIMGKASLFKLHVFDQTLSPTEDYDLWTRLAGEGVQMANLPDSLVRYRLHAAQASQQKSELLDRLSKKIRAIYCARLLNDSDLVAQLQTSAPSMATLNHAAAAVMVHCASHPELAPVNFRFMLAWIYQSLPHQGVLSWWHWHRLQKELALTLDANYRFNIALLAFLPSVVGRRYATVLLKLKR